MNGFHLLQKRKSARESKTIFKLNLATKPLQCELVVTVTQVGAGKWPPTGLKRELRQRTGRWPTLASRSPHSDAALMWPFSFICVTSHFLFLQLFCVIFPSLSISSVNAMPPKTPKVLVSTKALSVYPAMAKLFCNYWELRNTLRRPVKRKLDSWSRKREEFLSRENSDFCFQQYVLLLRFFVFVHFSVISGVSSFIQFFVYLFQVFD